MTAHVHAALMAQYAQDALTTDTPYDLWEWYSIIQKKWCPVSTNPLWTPTVQYRRKPEKQWYRVALMKGFNCTYTVTIDSTLNRNVQENSVGFLRWLTDTVYYDES